MRVRSNHGHTLARGVAGRMTHAGNTRASLFFPALRAGAQDARAWASREV